jgi:16S rRNA C967 or C1407 C5-methylase (RsmB/RsmF family)
LKEDVMPPPTSTQFSPELRQYFTDLFGVVRTTVLGAALCDAGNAFFLRTNTLRTTSEKLVSALSEEGVESEIFDSALDVVAIPIKKRDSIPHHGKIVVADKPSSENVLLGSNLYRPGVRRVNRFHAGDSVTVVNPRGHIVGSGVAAVDSTELHKFQRGLVVRITAPFYELPSLVDLEAYNAGLFYSQSLPAILVAPALNPQPNEVIIDFCAAPGGKTTHIGQLTENQCRVIAVDRSARRLTHLDEEVKRLGVTCVQPFVGRARDFLTQFPGIKADRVLVDPPCTALGVRPKLYDTTTLARIQSTANYQQMILDSSTEALRSGGILVYSTCTLSWEENERNIGYLLAEKGFTLVSQNISQGAEGIGPNAEIRKFTQRFYPDIHNLPGYFIAKLRKNG